MKWSIRLGCWAGVEVYLHVTFLLLLGFAAFAGWSEEHRIGAALSAVVFLIALFLCVLLHEFGHALAARNYGIRTRDITLLPIGGLARLERMPRKPLQELWVALAGPAVNMVIAGGILLGFLFSGSGKSFDILSTGNGDMLHRLLAVNLLLVLFNLLPAFPMDGGRVLRALLAMKLDFALATRIAARIGRIMALIFAFAGLFLSPMLVLIAIFVWFGGTQEAAAAEIKSSLAGARIRDAMVTKFRTLQADETLGQAAHQLLAGAQRDFPVFEQDRFVGLLAHREVLLGLRERGENTRVSEVMRKNVPTLDPDMELESAFDKDLVGLERDQAIPVLRDGCMVGILTGENLQEFLVIRTALQRQRGTKPPFPPGLATRPRLSPPQEI